MRTPEWSRLKLRQLTSFLSFKRRPYKPRVLPWLPLKEGVFQRADYSDAIAYNLKNEAAQSEFNKKAMHAEATARARAGNPGPAPSLGMSLGLGLAGAAIDAYSTYHVSAPSRRGDIKSASSTKKRPPTYPGI